MLEPNPIVLWRSCLLQNVQSLIGILCGVYCPYQASLMLSQISKKSDLGDSFQVNPNADKGCWVKRRSVQTVANGLCLWKDAKGSLLHRIIIKNARNCIGFDVSGA